MQNGNGCAGVAGKQEAILKYITELPAGERISVRRLAKTLAVSEGTAFKAIRRAEAEGLVQTRARGSVRVQGRGGDTAPRETLRAAANRLGLSLLAGAAFADTPPGAPVLADGDEAQLRQALTQAGERPLCLVGNRPELVRAAVAAGADVVVTGGAPVGHTELLSAEARGVCVLASPQDSLTVLARLAQPHGAVPADGGRGTAAGWMRTPLYLYYDDIVADLYRLYRPVFSMFSKCAVVNNDLGICGAVDSIQTLTSSPSQKIAKLYLPDGQDCFTADESTPMETLADRMIAAGTATAYITRDGQLCGLVTANDALRFFRRRDPAGEILSGRGVKLEAIDRDKAGLRLFAATLPEAPEGAEAARQDMLFSLLLRAARLQSEELLGAPCAVSSGTFYALEKKCASGELLISFELLKRTPITCTLECEIYDELACYARCVVTTAGGGEEKAEGDSSCSR